MIQHLNRTTPTHVQRMGYGDKVESIFELWLERHGVTNAPCPASSFATGHFRTGMPAR
ncbi:hypothetical protein SynPROS71_00500 [Synechococcus sp. PROS-7-1]|nr:hypothetical protein SynPROS71_00500 [Synechococcus sp. PROS-7-1]